MSKIAVIIDEDFEDSEYQKPADTLRQAGHQLTHIGLTKDAEIMGKKEQSHARIDQSVTEASVDQFDALLIPGGYSPDKEVVEDRNIISSRSPDDIPAFNNRIIKNYKRHSF